MEIEETKAIIEALLFMASEPIDIRRIGQVLEIEPSIIRGIIAQLAHEYTKRGGGLEITEIAGGYQMTTKAEYASWIEKLYGLRRGLRLSRPALETLTIIAYRQAITKAEIEAFRGVDVQASLKTLLERGLIRIAGRKEAVGHPLLYRTTKEFLRCFGLRRLGDLPRPDELKDISTPELSVEEV